MTNNSPLPFTKFGDDGETMLANGKTTSKYDIRIDCVGCIDEINSFIVLGYGVLKDDYRDLDDNYKGIRDKIGFQLNKIQNLLFVAGSDISYSVDRETEFRITQSHVKWLEKCIKELHDMLPPLKDFILPNNEFHICRSITRKAERRCWEMRHICGVNKNLLVFLNRLSDYFFTVGRTIHSDFVWDKGVVDGEL